LACRKDLVKRIIVGNKSVQLKRFGVQFGLGNVNPFISWF
jgi:hypothetical protein